LIDINEEIKTCVSFTKDVNCNSLMHKATNQVDKMTLLNNSNMKIAWK